MVIELAPAPVRIEEASIRGIPLYDGDVETESGIPEAVRALKERIASADGVLLVTPEYNNSLPGPFKNAIDWLSRPPADIPRVFGNRPDSADAVPRRARAERASRRRRGCRCCACSERVRGSAARCVVSGANKVFDEAGRLTDDKLRERIRAFITGFAEFASSSAR